MQELKENEAFKGRNGKNFSEELLVCLLEIRNGDR